MEQHRPDLAPGLEVDAAELAEWIETWKISTTRLRPGYDIDQVDAFLRAIRDTFLGVREPSLTPDEIRKKRFETIRLRPSYDTDEVDDVLDEAESRLAAQVRARGEVPVPLNAEDSPKMGCPYCDAFVRRGGFPRHFWKWLTHPASPVMEHQKMRLRTTLIVTAAILAMAAVIFLMPGNDPVVLGGGSSLADACCAWP